ncbi:MAG: alginate export family protein [Bacteroidales bacterium]
MKRIITTIVFISTLSYFSMAQFIITGDIRPRAELRHGYKIPATDTSVSAFFISQRTRLSAKYSQNDFIFKFGIQDIRVWGEDDIYTSSGTFGDTESLQTSEAWVKYKMLPNLSATIGRQPLHYDSQRILSTRNWNQHGLFYDALVFTYHVDSTRFDAGVSFNNTEERVFGRDYFSNTNKFQALHYLYAKHMFSRAFALSTIFITTGYTKPHENNSLHYMFTNGLVANYSCCNSLSIDGEGYYQYGHNNTGTRVRAYFITGNIAYTHNKRLRAHVGIDYMSGHDDSHTNEEYRGTDHSFDLLYGARYKYFGNMNQFMFVGKPYERAGMRDVYASATWSPVPKHSTQVAVHKFAFSQDYPTSEHNRHVAYEIDVMYNYKISDIAQFKVGGGYLLPGNTLLEVKNINAADEGTSLFAWISCSLKPTIHLDSK